MVMARPAWCFPLSPPLSVDLARPGAGSLAAFSPRPSGHPDPRDAVSLFLHVPLLWQGPGPEPPGSCGRRLVLGLEIRGPRGEHGRRNWG
jgi:hypothetical protein